MIKEVRCFRKDCSNIGKYYCCDPKQAACNGCSDQICERCKKPRYKPLKSLKTSQNSHLIMRKCFKCNQLIKNQCVSFKCSHHLCLKCLAKRICLKIALHKTGGKVSKLLLCQCQNRSELNIDYILDKYCVCCGQPLQNQIVQLKQGLKLRRSCKLHIRSQIEDSYSDETFMNEQTLEKLSFKCQKCSVLLQQDKKHCSMCQKRDFFKKSEERQPSLDKEISFQRVQSEEARQILKIPILATKSQRNQPEKRCLNCHDILDGSNSTILSQIQIDLCQTCIDKNLCCFAKLDEQAMKIQNSERIPVKEDKRLKEQNNGGNFQVNQNKFTHYPSQNSASEILKCIVCGKQQIESLTKTISSDLGGHLCSSCLREQHSQMDRLSQSVNSYPEKKNFNQSPQKDVYRGDILQGKFSFFGANIVLDDCQSKPLVSPSDRLVGATIIMSHPDQVELLISSQAQTSCFRCGYFTEQHFLIQHFQGKVCLTCFIWLQTNKE